MTEAECDKYNVAESCYICDRVFTGNNIKVRDYCHVSGKYRGAAHKICNLQLKLLPEIHIIFQNLKGYDCHHLMLKIGEIKKNFNVIPKT